MLIRSQNKEVLTNLNALAGIEIAEGPVKTVITSYITGCSYLLVVFRFFRAILFLSHYRIYIKNYTMTVLSSQE